MLFQKYEKLFSGSFFLLIGILLATQINKIKITNISMDSRLLPIIVVSILSVIGLLLVIEGIVEIIKQKNLNSTKLNFGQITKKNIKNILCCFLITVLFVYLLPIFGFIISGSMLLFGIILTLTPKGKQYKRENIIYYFLFLSVAITTGIYFLFVKIFLILLPRGNIWP